MSVMVTGTAQAVIFETPTGFGAVSVNLELGVVSGIEEELPTTIAVVVTGAAAGEVITFTVDGTTVATSVADSDGYIGPIDIEVDESVVADFTVTATGPTSGTSSQGVSMPAGFAPAGGTTDPGVDAAPVNVGAPGRWVLQDLKPGGLGSWVFPINPTTMSNPHVEKAVTVTATTAAATGQRHASQGYLGVVQWIISGYCPDEAVHTKLMAYAAIQRRIYVIDHRGRAWKCAIASLEITPRKRHIESDGSPEDWAGDYRLVFDLLDQTFQSV